MITTQINQANGRLKAGQIGLRIYQRGNRLTLRGTFPPKPGKGDRSSQQILSPGIWANPDGLKLIEAMARRVRLEIDSQRFAWSDYLPELKTENEPEPELIKTIAQWVEEFEAFYFESRKRTPQSQLTWSKDYLCSFRKLTGETLSKEAILGTVKTTEPETKTRQRVCMALSALAKFAGIEVDLEALKGNYSADKVNPRTLPSDDVIAAYRDKIPDEKLRWVYGMLATYGLRPHEIFYLDFSELPILNVLAGKTGPRKVWPCYPEWLDRWQLEQSFSLETSGKNNSEKTAKLDKKFKKIIPFHLYDLRHSWARRTLEFQWPHSLAAQQMGHSLSIHSRTYHAWIGEAIHQRTFEKLTNRTDRPIAP